MLWRDIAILFCKNLDDPRQIDSMDKFHGDIIGAIDAAKVVHLGDIEMVDADDDSSFIDEHRDKFLAFREVRQDFFNGNGFFKPANARHCGAIDLGHPTTSDKLVQGVRTESLRKGFRHKIAGSLAESVPGCLQLLGALTNERSLSLPRHQMFLKIP